MSSPVHLRICTDIPCVIILVSFSVIWIVISGIVLNSGDPSSLLGGVDYEGNVCGQRNIHLPGLNKPGRNLVSNLIDTRTIDDKELTFMTNININLGERE